MKESARYLKIVEWSEEDNCFVGSCPGLFYGGCHGDDEKKVFAKTCDLVEEIIELYKREGRPLPPPDKLLSLSGSGKDLWSDERADDYVRRLREDWH